MLVSVCRLGSAAVARLSQVNTVLNCLWVWYVRNGLCEIVSGKPNLEGKVKQGPFSNYRSMSHTASRVLCVPLKVCVWAS